MATFFKHTVFVYSTERPALPPLKLYHTRDITVRQHSCTHQHDACLLELMQCIGGRGQGEGGGGGGRGGGVSQ